MKKVLIIDDEEKLRSLLAKIISLEGYEVVQISGLTEAFKLLESNIPDVILCDVKLADGNGVEATLTLKEKSPCSEVILLTAYGNIPDSVKAIQNGAFDYLTKGDDNNRIIPLVLKAAEKATLNKKVADLQNRLDAKYSFDSVSGNSPAIQSAKELALKVSATDTTILLTGETGTGKEVFAQAIHYSGKRKQERFIAVNCSAISHDLLESELFGHRAGAFTGATRNQKGLFEEANNGTLFLDEIGEMHIDLQAKLLRVLESGEFIRIGEGRPVKVNVRIIAATNRDLVQEIKKGLFREDLYYRISVFNIHLPPLRERKEDIAGICEVFLNLFCAKTKTPVKRLATETLSKLEQYPWKGNIRELKNVMERCVILQDGDVIFPETLPPEFQMNSFMPASDSFNLATTEKNHITRVLAHTSGNKTEAARLLGVALTTLYRKIDEYNLKS